MRRRNYREPIVAGAVIIPYSQMLSCNNLLITDVYEFVLFKNGKRLIKNLKEHINKTTIINFYTRY